VARRGRRRPEKAPDGVEGRFVRVNPDENVTDSRSFK